MSLNVMCCGGGDLSLHRRNAALGHGDGEDRTYPDQVVIKSNIAPESTNDKLSPTQFRAVCMARLHTSEIGVGITVLS